MLDVRFALRFAVAVAVKLGLISRPKVADGSRERFLIVHLAGHLGDIVMLLPMIEALRQAHPQARIECAVESSVASLVRNISAIDSVYALPLGMQPPITLKLSLVRLARIFSFYVRHMRRACPTVCIMPRWGHDLFLSTRLAFLTQAPRRIGFAEDVACNDSPFSRDERSLLTQVIRGGKGLHEPAKFVFLLERAGLVPSVNSNDVSSQVSSTLRELADKVEWVSLSARVGLAGNAKFAVVAPSATMPKKMWPLSFWVDVISAQRERGLEVVLLTGPSDANVADELAALCTERGLRVIPVAGKTSLLESISLISHAVLFFGNDSGPGHVAGSLGVPSVILFIAAEGSDRDGTWAPERIKPAGPLVAVCRPNRSIPPCTGTCMSEDAHCITLVKPEVVNAVALKLLGA